MFLVERQGMKENRPNRERFFRRSNKIRKGNGIPFLSLIKISK